jgi:hypothetical protein
MNPLVNKAQTAQTTTSMPIQATQAARPNPMQFMGQFMQNPIGALRSAGYNIPNGMNDPRQIVNYLINNGQLGGQKLNQLRGLAQLIGKK